MLNIEPYTAVILITGLVASLIVIQITIVDVLSLATKHTPGFPVPADHNNPLFRANRALANTNESIALFLLVVVFGIGAGADPKWLTIFAWVYFAGRVGHMICYYADFKLIRSTSFSVALVCLLGMLVVGFISYL